MWVKSENLNFFVEEKRQTVAGDWKNQMELDGIVMKV